MFSHRFSWDLRPNRLSLALAARKRAGAEILDLTESNPTRAGFHYPPEIAWALADERALVYDPSPAGSQEARAAVSGYYAARGYAASPGRILLTASTSEAYAYLFKLLADAGDEVLVPRPSYPLFEYLAAMEAVRVAQYPLRYHSGWSVDFEALESAVHPRTRAIVLVNPNNPTGSYLKRDELARLTELCSRRGLPLICDEVFSDYDLAPDSSRVATLAGFDEVLSFSLSGLSKIAGLPQMKLGWMVVNGPADQRAAALERLEWIADTFLSVSTPVQVAAPRLLAEAAGLREQISARTRGNLAYLREAVGGDSPFSLLAVEGGWYGTLRAPRIRSEEEWTLELLDRFGVLVQPGFFYDFDGEAYLVLSLLTEVETFREGVCRLTYFGSQS